jgi:hypothetical protein
MNFFSGDRFQRELLFVPSFCQSLLGKALFEHFSKIDQVASVISSSSAFRDSSVGANFLTNFVVDEKTIFFNQIVFNPEDCFSVQLTATLTIQENFREQKWELIFGFVKNLITKTKFLEASLRSLTVKSDSFTDDQARFLVSNLKRIEKFDMSFCRLITSSAIESVAAMCPKLEILGLNSCYDLEIDDFQQHLLKLENLRTLDLRRTLNMTDSGIQSLSTMGDHLSSLLFDYENLSDDSHIALAQMPALKSLGLHTGLTDRGCELLCKSTSITALFVDCCDISAAGVKWISSMKQLKTLMISYVSTSFVDEAIGHISKMENLTSLLFFCSMSRVGVEFVCKMSKLEVFDCLRGELDDEQMQAIRKAIFPGKVELSGEEYDDFFFKTFNSKNI